MATYGPEFRDRPLLYQQFQLVAFRDDVADGLYQALLQSQDIAPHSVGYTLDGKPSWFGESAKNLGVRFKSQLPDGRAVERVTEVLNTISAAHAIGAVERLDMVVDAYIDGAQVVSEPIIEEVTGLYKDVRRTVSWTPYIVATAVVLGAIAFGATR